MNRVKQIDANSTSVVTPEKELNRFLEEPKLGYKSNVWAWWFTNKDIYPSLYRIAIKHLVIPATSCDSERIFSTAGNIATIKRSRLSSEHLNMLIFLNQNLD